MPSLHACQCDWIRQMLGILRRLLLGPGPEPLQAVGAARCNQGSSNASAFHPAASAGLALLKAISLRLSLCKRYMPLHFPKISCQWHAYCHPLLAALYGYL